MAIPKKLQRMAYLRNIQVFMIKNLFNNALFNHKVNIELCRIARANQILIGANTPTFMFGSNWYPTPNPHPDSNRMLHKKFINQVYVLLDSEDKKIRNQKSVISSLISNIFSVIKHSDDLYIILPKELQEVLPIIDTTVFTIGPRLTTEEISEINLINAQNLNMLHIILMNRLLCARIT